MGRLLSNRAWILISVWFFLIIFLPWQGFYVLNDAYVYEWNVRHFFENNFILHPLTAPAVLFQTALGALIYQFTDTPDALRLLTAFFYLVGVVYFYKYLVLLGINKNLGFILTLTLMFNPLSIYSAFAFMSDMYFLSTIIVALYYFALYLKNPNRVDAVLSAVFLSFAILSRQVGIAFLAVFALIVVWRFLRGEGRRATTISFLIPFLVFGLYHLFYPKPIAYTEQSVLLTLEKLGELPFYFDILERSVKTVYYIGVFLLPVSVVYIYTVYKKELYKNIKFLITIFSSALVLLAFAAYFWFKNRELMFYLPNIISYVGFLPQSIHMGIKQSFFTDSPVIITLVSILSTSIIFGILVNRYKELVNGLKNRNLLLNLLAAILPTLIILALTVSFRAYYDRYLLITLPALLLVIGVALNNTRVAYRVGLLAVFMFAIPWVLFAHDYLSLNKTVWEIPDRYGMEKTNFRGGFEFDAYHRLDIIKDADDTRIFDRTWLIPDDEIEYFAAYTSVYGYCDLYTVNYPSFINRSFEGGLKVVERCE